MSIYLLCFFFMSMGVGPVVGLSSAASHELPRPESLEPSIAFWKDVFSRWDEDQVVYFDGRRLDRVYEIHRLPPSNGTRHRERERESLRAMWKDSLKDDLEALSRRGVDYENLEGRLYRLYTICDRSTDPDVYAEAAHELRSQRGIRETFEAGVIRSTRYLDAFREIFREEGVPEELVYLPHVESSYRWNARSSVGAVGMWQFMAYTGRKFFVVDQAVDERLDPYVAARGAARYLQKAADELGSWPLAITSYNHGVDGIRNAVRETGSTDIETIIRDYRGPLFGFAGRNFYPELLAAEAASEEILAGLAEHERETPLEFDEFVLPAYVKVNSLTDAFGVGREDLEPLNPGIRSAAWAGDIHLTKGMVLKLPRVLDGSAETLFAGIPRNERPLDRPQLTYRVRHGDSLGIIAARHKTSVRTLQRLNGIRNPNMLRVGTLLKLPS